MTSPADGTRPGSPDASVPWPGLPRAVVLLLGAAAAVVVATGIQAVAWLVGPVVLALVIVVTVHPVRGWLRRAGLSAWAATTVVLLVVYGVLLCLAGIVVLSMAQLANALPTYAQDADEVLASATGLIEDLGVDADRMRSVVGSVDPGRVLGLATGVLSGTTSVLSTLVLLLSLVLFLSIEASGAGARLALVAEHRPSLAAALAGLAGSVRRYVGVSTVFGLMTGLVDAVALHLLGVPLALLWGLLVFITNYLPYVGFWLGLVPPTLLALFEGGWQLMAVVAVLYTVVNFVLTSLIEPKFIGDTVDLSVSITLVALVFWAWLLGPLGAVLAVPLTLLVVTLLVDADPRAHWVGAFLRSTRAVHRHRADALPRPPGTAHLTGPRRC